MEFLDYLKEGAGIAREEVEKRTGLVRGAADLRRLRQQREVLVKELGERVLELFKGDAVAQDLIASECQAIITLEDQIARKELEMQRIAQLSAPTVAAPVYGHICPNCQIQLPNEAVFCPNCGSQAEDLAPPEPKTTRCPECKATIPLQSKFCRQCGANLTERVEAERISLKPCSACGHSFPEEAVFCPECGAKAEAPEPTSADASADVDKLEKGETG